MRKPCTGCPAANRYEYKGKERCNPGRASCMYCQAYIKNKRQLESKAKYRQGKQVSSLNEFDRLLNQDGAIFIHGKVWNLSWAISLQYRVVANAIKNGCVHAAVKKGDNKDNA